MSVDELSVLMPVYNGGRYVKQAIESILAQEYGSFRLFVVDDGSTDGTLDVLKSCAADDDRVAITSRPRTGYVVALNEMLKQVPGRYVARMDADDIAEPSRFAKQVAYLDSHPGCVALGTRVLLIDPDDLPIGATTVPTEHEPILERMLRGTTTLAHPSVMMRTEAVRAVGGYNPDYYTAEDYDLWLRLSEVGQLACLPEPLLRYRQHPASITLSKRREQVEVKRRIWREYIARKGYQLADSHFRASADYAAALHQRWAADALQNRYYRTARKHSLRNLKHHPTTFAAWSLFARAFVWSGLSVLPDAHVARIDQCVHRLSRPRLFRGIIRRLRPSPVEAAKS